MRNKCLWVIRFQKPIRLKNERFGWNFFDDHQNKRDNLSLDHKFASNLLDSKVRSSKTMITCSNPILVLIQIIRNSNFGPDSYFESGAKSEFRTIEKWSKIGIGHVITNFEEKLSGVKSDFRTTSITWKWTPSNTFPEQKRDPRVPFA